MKFTLAQAQTETGAGTAVDLDSAVTKETKAKRSFQAAVAGTGGVSATVQIQVSQNPDVLGWMTLGTISLSGTTTDTDGFVSDETWSFFRSNVTAISGTGASVTAVMGV